MRSRILATLIVTLLVACTSAPVATTFPAPTLTLASVAATPPSTVTIAAPTPTVSPTITPVSLPTTLPTATLIPSATPRPKTGAADEWLGKAAEREKLFNEYAQTIKDAQAFSELGFKRLGTTWEKEVERAKKRFLDADTKLDVYYAVLSLQRTIHDVHSALTVPAGLNPTSEAFSLPFTLGMRGNSLENAQYVVTQSSISEIKVGFMLKLYGSKTLQQLEYDYSEWLGATSPEQLKTELARALTRSGAGRYPSLDPNTPVNIVFIDPASQRDTGVTVRWQTGATDVPSQDYAQLSVDYAGINYRLYKDAVNQTIILVYASFNYSLRDTALKTALAGVSYKVPPFDNTQPLEAQSAWMTQFLQANEHPNLQSVRNFPFTVLLQEVDTLNLGRYLNQQTYPILLVDVRNNGGGSIPTNLTALLARERFKTPTFEVVFTPLMKNDNTFLQESLGAGLQAKYILDQLAREKEAVKSSRFPFNCKTSNCSLTEAEYDPNPSVKKFNVAVLSGPGCISSCDQFVSLIKDNNIGRVVGLPSRGADSPTRAKKEFVFKNGEKFSMVFTTAIGYRPNGELLEGNPASVEYYLFPEDDYVNKMIQHLKR